MGVWYCTRADVKNALDIKESAHRADQIDECIEAASRNVEGLCHRIFYPVVDTRFFSWPNHQYARSYRLWLDENELISVSSLSSGGTTIPSTDYFLEPANSGPPFRSIEIDLSSPSSFQSGDTHQRAITVTGTFGYWDESTPAGALAEALDVSETEVQVTDGWLAQPGHVLKVDDERMIVTEHDPLDSGDTLQSNVSAAKNSVTIPVSDGTNFSKHEIIIINDERMKIRAITGNNLTVERAFDGTVLEAHTASDTIYALRSLTVERGALGTTAASHSSGASMASWRPPEGVRTMVKGEALWMLLQETVGYGHRLGTDSAERDSAGRENQAGFSLPHLRWNTRTRYGRKARKGAV